MAGGGRGQHVRFLHTLMYKNICTLEAKEGKTYAWTLGETWRKLINQCKTNLNLQFHPCSRDVRANHLFLPDPVKYKNQCLFLCHAKLARQLPLELHY